MINCKRWVSERWTTVTSKHNDVWTYIRLQMYVYSLITHTQQATCNVLLATSFGSKNGPSSGYYIRTVKLETVYN